MSSPPLDIAGAKLNKPELQQNEKLQETLCCIFISQVPFAEQQPASHGLEGLGKPSSLQFENPKL